MTQAQPSTDPRVAELRDAVAAHRCGDAAETASRDEILRSLSELRAPFDQHADPTHVTGSAIVTVTGEQVVLHRHKRLGIWLQPGGHVDDGESAADGAVRETKEETGLTAGHPDGRPTLLHVDVHPGPRGHRHLDIRYLLTAPADIEVFAPGVGESPEVAWFTLDEALALADASLASAVRALIRRN